VLSIPFQQDFPAKLDPILLSPRPPCLEFSITMKAYFLKILDELDHVAMIRKKEI
jgi:hypothetical protein